MNNIHTEGTPHHGQQAGSPACPVCTPTPTAAAATAPAAGHHHTTDPTGGTPCHHDCACGHPHGHTPPLPPLRAPQASATRAVYRIMNMDCPMEEALIRNKLTGMEGILGLEFDLMQRVLVVNHALPSTESIELALLAIDMTPEALPPAASLPAADAAPKTPWRKLLAAGLCAALAEACHLLFAGQNLPALPTTPRVAGLPLTEILPLLLAVAAITLGGLTTFRKGWTALRNRNLNINALMSVAVTGAILIGQYPEAAMVTVLFTVAEALEAKSLDRARHAVRNLMELAPQRAEVQQADGFWREMDVRQATVGNIVRVRPGGRVAFDGVVVRGYSAVNQAPVTGESLPVEKHTGDSVYAGSINESGSFEFQITAAADDSTLARIIRAVEEAQRVRAPMQRFIDKFAAIYTPLIFLAAVLTALLPPLLLGHSWKESVYMGLVLLVIGCPCALVIATPVSIASGMAAAARQGLLIKGGLFLELGRKLTCLALDKTGTLTHGKPQLTDFTVCGMEETQALTLAASLAARSDHPVSRAIAAWTEARGIPPLPVEQFTALSGLGVRGEVNGSPWQLGHMRLAEQQHCADAAAMRTAEAWEAQGKSVTVLLGGGTIHALFAVADTLKPSSVEALRALKQLKVKTVMLTGDNEHAAQAVARAAGVDEWRAGLLPEEKLQAVADLTAQGITGMAGDGINDAPALARADVSFAMAAAGTDAAIETADVAIMDDDLRKIPRLIRLSRATYAILVQNLVLALGIKAAIFLLTLAGMGSMWLAVFADVGTSLLVVSNGLRALHK